MYQFDAEIVMNTCDLFTENNRKVLKGLIMDYIKQEDFWDRLGKHVVKKADKYDEWKHIDARALWDKTDIDALMKYIKIWYHDPELSKNGLNSLGHENTHGISYGYSKVPLLVTCDFDSSAFLTDNT